MAQVVRETTREVSGAVRKALDDFLNVLVLEPQEAGVIARTETYAIIRGALPPTPKELIKRLPRPPTPLELIPKPEDILPTSVEMRESVKQMIPSPKNVAGAFLEAVSPIEKVKTVAVIATPGAIIVGGVIIAVAMLAKP